MNIKLKDLSDTELIQAYSSVIKLLKERGIIRSKNIIGDLGEYVVIDYYNKTPGLPNLLAAPPGTQKVDALSKKGDRYSIKASTGRVTGVFYGLPPKDSDETPDRKAKGQTLRTKFKSPHPPTSSGWFGLNSG